MHLMCLIKHGVPGQTAGVFAGSNSPLLARIDSACSNINVNRMTVGFTWWVLCTALKSSIYGVLQPLCFCYKIACLFVDMSIISPWMLSIKVRDNAQDSFYSCSKISVAVIIWRISNVTYLFSVFMKSINVVCSNRYGMVERNAQM